MESEEENEVCLADIDLVDDDEEMDEEIVNGNTHNLSSQNISSTIKIQGYDQGNGIQVKETIKFDGENVNLEDHNMEGETIALEELLADVIQEKNEQEAAMALLHMAQDYQDEHPRILKSSEIWLCDCAASTHVTAHPENMEMITNSKQKITMGNGSREAVSFT